MTMPAAFLSSNKQDYATPWPLVEALEKELGRRFTLDVCASAKSAKAPKYYTEEMDAFKQDWGRDAKGGLIWCNPPYIDGWPGRFLQTASGYARPTSRFASANTTVFLLPANKTDQPWWHDLVIPFHTVWDVKGRVDFLDPETGEVPTIWIPKDKDKWKKDGSGVWFPLPGFEELGEDDGKWVKQSNPQASKIVIVGPNFPACLPRSFSWK